MLACRWVTGLLVPAYAPAAVAYKDSLEPPAQPAYEFAWPEPELPQTGRWSRAAAAPAAVRD